MIKIVIFTWLLMVIDGNGYVIRETMVNLKKGMWKTMGFRIICCFNGNFSRQNEVSNHRISGDSQDYRLVVQSSDGK